MDMAVQRYMAGAAHTLESPQRTSLQPAPHRVSWYVSVAPALRRTMTAFRRLLRGLQLDQRERYLSQAENHKDFERRLRAWDACEERRARAAFPSCQPF